MVRLSVGVTLQPMPSLDLAPLRALLGNDGVLDSRAARFTYEADVPCHRVASTLWGIRLSDDPVV